MVCSSMRERWYFGDVDWETAIPIQLVKNCTHFFFFFFCKILSLELNPAASPSRLNNQIEVDTKLLMAQ